MVWVAAWLLASARCCGRASASRRRSCGRAGSARGRLHGRAAPPRRPEPVEGRRGPHPSCAGPAAPHPRTAMARLHQHQPFLRPLRVAGEDGVEALGPLLGDVGHDLEHLRVRQHQLVEALRAAGAGACRRARAVTVAVAGILRRQLISPKTSASRSSATSTLSMPRRCLTSSAPSSTTYSPSEGSPSRTTTSPATHLARPEPGHHLAPRLRGRTAGRPGSPPWRWRAGAGGRSGAATWPRAGDGRRGRQHLGADLEKLGVAPPRSRWRAGPRRERMAISPKKSPSPSRASRDPLAAVVALGHLQLPARDHEEAVPRLALLDDRSGRLGRGAAASRR